MCKYVTGYFSMIIDDKDEVVVLPRSYKGSPLLGYSPAMLITTEKIYNKYKEYILCDPAKTQIVFMK
jgi:hypothetical protein